MNINKNEDMVNRPLEFLKDDIVILALNEAQN